jgi:hypothetical protein
MKHIITDKTISIFMDGQVHIIDRTDGLSIKILEALNAKEFDKIPKLLDLVGKIKELGGGLFNVVGDHIYVNGVQATLDVEEQIMNMAKVSD